MRPLILWRRSVWHALFFTVGSLATCIASSLTGKSWAATSGSDRFIIVMMIVANWASVMGAFINKSSNPAAGTTVQVTTTKTKDI